MAVDGRTNTGVIVGWVGLSLALVLGYGAYKNKPVFGKDGIVTTAIQTGKISGTSSFKSPTNPPEPATPVEPTAPTPPGYVSPYVYQPFPTTSYVAGPIPQPAPVAPSGPLTGALGGLRDLLGI